MKRIKKWICLTLLSVITLTSAISISSEAGHAAKYATVSPNGDIILTTYDHRKTSSVHYKTVGWTVTRCALGTMTPIDEQYFTVRFNDAVEDKGDIWTTSDYMIPESQVMSKIAEIDGSWLADIQGDSEQPCYLKFDAIMICIDDSKSDAEKHSGTMLSENNQDYLINPFAEHPGVWDKFTKDDLKYNTYGWAAPASIDTHFDIYLLYKGGKPKEPVISTGWYRDIYWYSPIDGKYNQDNGSMIESSLMRPKFYTWNTSDVYNLHDGIPSGEDITNGYGADGWCGYERVSHYEEERSYRLSYDLVYHTYEPEYEYGSDGIAHEVGTLDIVHHVPTTYDVTRKADYYYAMYLDLYEFDQTYVYNSVYPGDQINYTALQSANIKTILNGENNPASVADWATDPDKHIKWPEEYTDTIEIDCGEGIGSVNEMKAQLDVYLYDDVIDGWDYIKEVSSWNDLVEINGTKYLNDEVVTHANDTTKVRGSQTETAMKTQGELKYTETVADNYMFHEQEETVTIPKDVANGAYSTDLEVQFRRKVIADNMLKPFASWDILNGSQDSIYNHLKPGYEQNEPVFVHTPVIAPVTVKNGEETTQLIHENRSNDMSSSEEEKKEYGLVKDGKAAYEMILDNEYTFTFDPAQHRDIQGYGWSESSADGTGYRKYIKNRWVRFPFTIQIKNNETGKWSPFYKVGANGYTDWINIYEEGDYLESWYSDDTIIYIPPWAMEGNYSQNGEGRQIEYKVEAYNVNDENGTGHENDQEDYANSGNLAGERDNEAQTYVATYKVPVELSGIIYNFEILGSNYYQPYNADRLQYEDHAIPFAPFRMEKKQGNRNRAGGTSVRYTLDGKITTAWQEKNTLPMAVGNAVWRNQGYLISGDTISFSVKTIANLWNELPGMDYVHITPTFRWYDWDGTEHKDVQVYYWDDSESYTLIRYGSAADLKEMVEEDDADPGWNNQFNFFNCRLAGSLFDTTYAWEWDLSKNVATPDRVRKTIAMGDGIADYNGTYHDEDLLYTLDYHNRHYTNTWTFKQLLWQTSRCYCLCSIDLNSMMRTLTGNYEELLRNKDNDPSSLVGFETVVDPDNLDVTIDTDTEDKMKYSMQTWYGDYYIPQNMLICEADTFKNMGITDQDGDGEIDYWDYMAQTGETVDENADFWLNENVYPYGYLVMNFDIITYNEGKPHLSYWSVTKDMWELQGRKEEVTIGDPGIEEGSDGKYPVTKVPTKSGDVAVIHTEFGIADHYSSGLFMIN